MTDIKTRADVNHLVRSFYTRIRKDDFLGPVFENQIEDWEAHIEKLTDFWETNLFFVRNYKGNPLKVHQLVDEHEGFSLTQKHFGLWMNHWFQTIDELFEGDLAQVAKNRARKMASFMFLKIFSVRPQEFKKL